MRRGDGRRAVKLQSLARRRKAARIAKMLRARRAIEIDAAATIQVQCRHYLAWKERSKDKMARAQEDAASRIQSVVRGRSGRKQTTVLHAEAARRASAAIKLQRRARLNAAARDRAYYRATATRRSGATALNLGRQRMLSLSSQQGVHVTGESAVSARALERKLREMSGEIDGGEAYTAETLGSNLASLAPWMPVPMEDIETEQRSRERQRGFFIN